MMRARLGVSLLLATALVPCFMACAWAKTPAPIKPDLSKQPVVMPQDDVLPATLDEIWQNRTDIDQALVVVQMGQKEDNPQWIMSSTQLDVLLDTLLQFMPEKPVVEDAIWPKLKRPDPKYKGLRVVLRTVWGRHFEPFTVFEGNVTAASGRVMTSDYGRRLEYWMFGTSRIRRDQMVGATVLPVLTFEQCRLLGQQIVETRPRQCLLPDNNLLLETNEMPTLAAAKIKDFDGCLKNGKALIYTFPRRCLAAGGRVFTEPPRVYDILTPADAPLATPPLFNGALPQPAGPNVDLMGGGGLQLNTQFGGPLQSGTGGGAGTPLTPQ